jgi:murein DD-endopeptidase MepM/ murein hydrolase activator NlpD
VLVVSLFGVGVCAAFGMLIGLSPFDSSSAAVPREIAEVEDSTLGNPSAQIAAIQSSTIPNTAAPDTAAPNTAAPATAKPDTANPVTTAPITTTPVTTVPDTAVRIAAAPAPIPRAEIEPVAETKREVSTDISKAVSQRVAEGVLERGDTLVRSLSAQGVSVRVVDQIARQMIGYYDFRNSQPGHGYRLVQNAAGEIESFHYRISPIIGYELSRGADGSYTVLREETALWPRRTMIAGIVTSSLYGAITDLGAGPQLASDFTDVFAYDVDFSRMIRAGDEFRILYEQLFRTGEDGKEIFVRPGRILAARYAGTAGEHTAVYFESGKGRGGYYRPDGSTVQREFLMAPVRYGRVTSRYAAARRHPILKITRPHHGIDYAAATGTPVFAVAAGEVIYSSRAGGFGNLVKIRHDSGYVTYYGHLSRFADGLRVGQPVSQKQVIGFVGSTGLSTGPHVCFRVAKDGKYVNPIQLPTPEGPPLPEQFARKFQAHRDTLLASLDSGTLVAADEAL